MRQRQPDNTPDSEALAFKARAGCDESFSELVRRHSDALRFFLKRKTRNEQDAEDLVQETFLRAHAQIRRYSSDYSFKTWLFTIGSRLAINLHRKNAGSRNPAIADVDPDLLESPALAEDKAPGAGIWGRVKDILPESQYEVVRLRYGEELDVREIARRTGLTRVYVRVQLHRARLKLAEEFKEESRHDLLAD